MKLRNPWEYLQKKVFEHLISFMIQALFTLTFVWIFIWFSASQILLTQKVSPNTISIIQVGLLLLLWFLGYFLYKVIKNFKQLIHNNKKWIEWEKIVAYELALLQSKNKNFYIINDFQHPKVWNIDHIVIHSKWIFAIETKNYTKIYEDSKNEAIKQAKKSALILQGELKNSFSINWVTPILTFIWQQAKTQDSIVKISSPEQLNSIIMSSNSIIDPDKIKEIFLYLNKIQQTKKA